MAEGLWFRHLYSSKEGWLIEGGGLYKRNGLIEDFTLVF